MIKLIASDMDGTLLNSDHELSRENLEAIKKAEEKGIRFVIATGRIYCDVELILKKNNLKCQCILMNGAEYRDEKANVLERIDIDKDKLRGIFYMMNRYNLPYEIYTNQGIFTAVDKEKAFEGIVHRVQAFEPGITMEKAVEMAKVHEHYINLKYIQDIDNFLNSQVKIGKFLVFYNDTKVLKNLKDDLEGLGGLAISASFHTNLEVNDINAQKGHILSKVIKKIGVKKEEVMVIGDSYNDCSMFERFPVSFAMGNSKSEIKKMAKYITDTNDNSGVAKAIYKVLDEGI